MHQTLRTESRASHAVCAFAVLVLAAAAFAAQVDPPAVEWEQTWLPEAIAALSSVIIQLPDGGYIATGTIITTVDPWGEWDNSELWLGRGDADGNLLWSKTYRDVTKIDSGGITLCLSDDGGYVVAPGTWDDTRRIRHLVKFDKDGNLVWNRVYGEGHDTYVNWSDIANTPNGGYVLTGWYNGGQPGGVITATDGDGNRLWERIFMESPGAESNYPFGVITTADGEYIATGYTAAPYPPFGMMDSPYVAKFGRDGSFTWEKFVSFVPYTPEGGYDPYTLRVREVRDGGFIVAGTFLARTDAEGNTLWSKRLAIPQACQVCTATWIEQTSDGGYIIVGDDMGPGWIAKYDGNGDFVWMRYPPDNVNFRCVRQTGDGGYIAYGAGGGEGNGLRLIKLAPESTTITFRRGRIDGDDVLNLADAICLLGYLFGPADAPCKQTIAQCLDAADANDDDNVDIADAIAVLNYVFGSALPLREPFGSCGIDPTADDLDCQSYSLCR